MQKLFSMPSSKKHQLSIIETSKLHQLTPIKSNRISSFLGKIVKCSKQQTASDNPNKNSTLNAPAVFVAKPINSQWLKHQSVSVNSYKKADCMHQLFSILSSKMH